MHRLDNAALRTKLDRAGAIRAIDFLPEQARQAWHESYRIRLPVSHHRAHEIVMSGMGGSGLAGHIVEAAFRNRLRVPFFLTHGYDVPAHVRRHTLYIVSSYSGTTEEVLETARRARRQGAQLLGISGGGPLGRAIGRTMFGYKFLGTYNPGGVPRLGQGYMIFGLLGLLQSTRHLTLTSDEVAAAIKTLEHARRRFNVAVPHARNRAKQLATELQGKIPVFVGAEFLEDSARIMSNQLHESAKQFGFHFAIPELNHHLMEGLAFPRGLAQKLAVVFLTSDRYEPRVKKRFAVTAEVVRKHRIPSTTYRVSGKEPLAQIADVLAFGSYATYYCGLLNGVDPSPNPWVDYFKRRLGK